MKKSSFHLAPTSANLPNKVPNSPAPAPAACPASGAGWLDAPPWAESTPRDVDSGGRDAVMLHLK